MKRMLTRKPFSKMTGLTLLETMFALAVGALVLIGAVIFYVSTKQSGNTSKAAGDMNAIVAAIQNYTAQGYGLTDATIANLQKNGYLPDPILDPWGQEYTITLNSTAPASVDIDIPGIALADNSCVAITQTLVGTAAATPSATTCEFRFPL